MNHFVYKKPVAGPGYRLLRDGEIIYEGRDEVWAHGRGPWINSEKLFVGEIMNSDCYWPVRRKLPTGETALLDFASKNEE